jgi:hypothetical protein
MLPKFEDIELRNITDVIDPENLYPCGTMEKNYIHWDVKVFEELYCYNNIYFKVSVIVKCLIYKDIFGNIEAIKSQDSSFRDISHHYILKYELITPTIEIVEFYNSVIKEMKANYSFEIKKTSLETKVLVDKQDFEEAIEEFNEYILNIDEALKYFISNYESYMNFQKKKFDELNNSMTKLRDKIRG